MAEISNGTLEELSQNAGEKSKMSTELITAYSSLIIMAIIPIFYGSFRSVKVLKKQKELGETSEVLSHKDAALFPFLASIALFGLYIIFKVFPKEYINIIISAYFVVLAVISLTYIFKPYANKLLPECFEIAHHVIYSTTEKENTEVVLDYTFNNKDVIALFLGCTFGGVYLWSKHWMLSNILAVTFALNGIELLHLNSIFIGCILLMGLLIYDIFWVFGTNVMTSVAKSLEAPVKLVFPKSLFGSEWNPNNFAMLGLGDVVIPGIFIALLLRFDESLKRKQHIYFYTSFVAYCLGLILTTIIAVVYEHGQPALLYLVPVSIGSPLLVAAFKGDIGALFNYEDYPTVEDEKDSSKEHENQNSEAEENSSEVQKCKVTNEAGDVKKDK